MYKYKNIEEAYHKSFSHIVAGAFFQMQKSCISRLPEINTLITGEVLYVDVFPGSPNEQLLLSSAEREALLRQLGAAHYVSISSRDWPVALKTFRTSNSNGIYKGPFFLSGLEENGIDVSLLKNFLSIAFNDTGKFHWQKELGYYFPLKGEVVYGNQVGRTLGYPTLNISPSDSNKVIPPMGVYTGFMKYTGKWFKTMINIGIRPTLDMSRVTIEAHVFDFSEEIYGDEVTLHFTGRIRDEMRFPSLDSLKSQLHSDRDQALKDLSKLNLQPGKDDEFLIFNQRL